MTQAQEPVQVRYCDKEKNSTRAVVVITTRAGELALCSHHFLEIDDKAVAPDATFSWANTHDLPPVPVH